jgi:hypothetical protein
MLGARRARGGAILHFCARDLQIGFIGSGDEGELETASRPEQSARMTRIASTFALAAVLTIAFATCRHFQYDAHPLYEGEVLPAAEVAKLSGPIAKVDGVDVSHRGSLFALLPGCHIVELPTQLGEGTSNGAWSVNIGHVSYALAMKAGRLYAIDTELQPGSSASTGNASVGGVKVTATERDVDGKAIAKLSRVHNKRDIESCRAADASLRVPSTKTQDRDASIAPRDRPPAAAQTSAIDGGTQP